MAGNQNAGASPAGMSTAGTGTNGQGQSAAAANSVTTNYNIPTTPPPAKPIQEQTGSGQTFDTGTNSYVTPSSAPTSPAPTIVTAQPATDAVNNANQNVSNYNASVTPPPTNGQNGNGGAGGNPPNNNGNPSGNPPGSQPNASQTYFSYTDPNTKQTSYYDGNGNQVSQLPQGANAESVPAPLQSTTGQYNPYQPGANVDSNGNIVGPNGTPTGTPGAYAQGTAGDVAGLNSQIAASNANIAAAGNAANNYFQSWLSGTIPFSPAQTNLIQSMQNNMTALVGLQQNANASYIGSVTEATARNGAQGSNPTNAMAMIHQATVKANLDLGALQSAQSMAIAQTQEAFQKENYDEMLTANDQYMKSQEDIQTTLENLATNIQKSITDAQTFNHQVAQDSFTNSMASANLSLGQKQEAYNEFISNATLTEKEKTDAQQIFDEQTANSIAKAQLLLAEGTFDNTWGTGGAGSAFDIGGGNGTGNNGTNSTQSNGSQNNPPPPTNSDGSTPATGQITYSPQTGKFTDSKGNPITGDALAAAKVGLNAVGVHTYDDGLAYFDPTGFSNQTQAAGMENHARSANIPPLAAADASIVNNLEAAKKELSNMETAFSASGAPSSVATMPFSTLKKLGSASFGGSTSQAQAAYTTAQDSLYAILSSLSESKRANGGEFEVGQVSLPNVNTLFGSLKSNGLAQFKTMEGQLNSLIASIVPGFQAQPNPAYMNTSDLLNFGANSGGVTSSSGSSDPFGSAYSQ